MEKKALREGMQELLGRIIGFFETEASKNDNYELNNHNLQSNNSSTK